MSAVDLAAVRAALDAIDKLGFDGTDKASPWRDLRAARDRLAVLAGDIDGITKSARYRHLNALRASGLEPETGKRPKVVAPSPGPSTPRPPAPAEPRERECAMPGCERLVVGHGHARYCDLPDHNPQRAADERKRRERKPMLAQLCQCDRPVVDGDGDCARCGRTLRRGAVAA